MLDKDILKAEELLAVFLGSVCASFSIFVIFSLEGTTIVSSALKYARSAFQGQYCLWT